MNANHKPHDLEIVTVFSSGVLWLLLPELMLLSYVKGSWFRVT